MDEDIFMDYTSSNGQSSPISSFSIPFESIRLGKVLGELKELKNLIMSVLKLPDTNKRLRILELRRFNRHLFTVVNEHRKRLNELRTSIDNLNNKLLCHKFEKQHLLDEIKSCQNSNNIFNTIEIELVDSELENDPEYSVLSEHEKMIKKLHWELAKRQNFQERLLSILQKKQDTETELAAKKRKLEDLRVHLQSLLKNCKPISDVCGHEARKIKMQVDDEEENHTYLLATTDSSLKNANEEFLLGVYEKLIAFVSEKSNYKLRYFEQSPLPEDQSIDEDDETKMSDYVIDESRNPSIKSAYIHIELRDETNDGDEAINFYLKNTDSDILLLSCSHELIPETNSANWIKSLKTIACLDIVNESNLTNISWIAPEILQNDPFGDNYDQLFSSLKDAVSTRKQIQELIDQVSILEFDKTALNEFYLVPSKDLKAEVSMISVTWSSSSTEFDKLASELNLIGSKYRSILDCLREQVGLLLKHLSEEREN